MRKKGNFYSLIDIAMMVTQVKTSAEAAQQIRRVCESYEEDAKCVNLKFPGRGQRDTPVGFNEAMRGNERQ